jgi:hypothetical protein
VQDLRALNAAALPQVLRRPLTADIVDQIGESKPKYFSVIDCTHGFFQVPLKKESIDYTAFIVGDQKYRWTRMPQGFKNSSAVFQALLDLVLRGVQYLGAMSFVDDIIIFTTTLDNHIRQLDGEQDSS